MNVLEMILKSGGNGGSPVEQLARQFNLQPGQAQAAIGELLGPLTRGITQNMTRPGGLDSLVQALGRGTHQQYIDRPEALTHDGTVADGNKILGHILGSKDVSRQVAGDAAAKTGIDPSILKQMLPMVASLVMGAMSKKAASAGVAPGQSSAQSAGGIVDLLTSFLGGSSGGKTSVGGGLLGSLLGKLFGR